MALERKSQEKQPDQAAPLGVTATSVRLEPMENVAVYYVNYIEVVNSPYDFSLICAKIPGKLTSDKLLDVQQHGALVVEPEVQITIPTILVPGLIKALTVQKENYEKIFGVEIKEVGVTS